MSMSDREIPETKTDWLANSVVGYGFGYTDHQALAAMLAHASSGGPLDVTLVEHRGDATVGPTGYDVDEFVQERTVTLDDETVRELSELADESWKFEAALE